MFLLSLSHPVSRTLTRVPAQRIQRRSAATWWICASTSNTKRLIDIIIIIIFIIISSSITSPPSSDRQKEGSYLSIYQSIIIIHSCHHTSVVSVCIRSLGEMLQRGRRVAARSLSPQPAVDDRLFSILPLYFFRRKCTRWEHVHCVSCKKGAGGAIAKQKTKQ